MSLHGPLLGLACLCWFCGCSTRAHDSASVALVSPASSATQQASPADAAPPPDKTGGFDGKRAFDQVAKQVGFGPRPSGSPAIAQLQQYLQSELTSYGCKVDSDDFHAETPVGRLAMKNIVAKIPGEKPGIIMLATHYDTKLMPNFVGADDAGSSSGLMLELARLLCSKHDRYNVWITFFDGEEAMKEWSDTDSRYGSRQMAAKMATSGDLKKLKAFLLADIVGGRKAQFLRESSSTPDLVNLFWNTAQKLGYSDLFRDGGTSAEDDHDPFLKRGVPSLDVIGDFANNGYWHTPQDSLDKISPKTLAVVGHVFLESLKILQSK